MDLGDLVEMEKKKIQILYNPCANAGYCLGERFGYKCNPDDESCAYFALLGRLNNQKKALEGEKYEKKSQL